MKSTGAFEIALKGVGVALAGLAAKELTDVIRDTAEFAEALQDQARFLEISQGALAGQVLAYETIGRSQEDAIETYARLNMLVEGAISGNQEYVNILGQVGIAEKNIKDIDLATVYAKTKKAVDNGNLSYKDAEKILGQDLTKALDDVRINQNAIADDAVDAAGNWQESWASKFRWWDSVELEAKEIKFNIGAAFGDLFNLEIDPILKPNQPKPYTPPDDPSADPFSVEGRTRWMFPNLSLIHI